MKWLARMPLLLGLLLLVALVAPGGLAQQKDQLEQEKLRQEISKLENENDWLSSRWGRFLRAAPILTALVAVAAAALTLWKHINETGRHRHDELVQREKESVRRFDEKFTSIVANLGAESPSLQASAAASLMTFLRPGHEEFFDDIFLLVVANLGIKRDRVVRNLLTRVFEKAIRVTTSQRDHLDLSRTYLARVDLHDIDLNRTSLDIAFADLRSANLTGLNAFRLRGIKVNLEGARLSKSVLREGRFDQSRCRKAQFHGATLASSTFKGADLREAQFQKAGLQSVHLERADLRGARFEASNLSDAFFYGAQLDDAAMHSITRALGWQKAHFDDAAREKLRGQ